MDKEFRYVINIFDESRDFASENFDSAMSPQDLSLLKEIVLSVSRQALECAGIEIDEPLRISFITINK
jgi:hypothetical protein